ncbi:Na+:solute symporter [Ramlibacter sp. AW1]|uniref:Na+:solute symporter n=1 Tax=Ramlibacter aurantiacus TaxID=2801330 RepID=A0A936ZHG2_9BURK|nr:sodium:solute symporter family protein [Ramlibacter aurantiacus]MBL0421509.1 Na+:solute symporter [Ramlibacter aurantiacus]
MLDLLILGAFVLYSIGSGLHARGQASHGLDEYFLAGRRLPGWQAGTSMAATQFAADTPLLVTGLVATAGVFSLWRLWIYALAFLAMAFVFSAGWRRAGVLTDAELAEVRYSGRGVVALRLLKAIYYGTVINCVVLAMVLVAAIRIAEVFMPWHEWLPPSVYLPLQGLVVASGFAVGDSITGLAPAVAHTNSLVSIVLILAFTAAYSITGGLRAVVRTDVMQFALAMIGTALYAWFALDAAGGLAGLPDRLAALYGSDAAARMLSFTPPSGGEVLMPFLVLIGLQWLFQMNADGTGYLAQRSMACHSDLGARRAPVLFAWLQVFLRSLLWLAIALGLLVLYPFSPADAASPGFAAARELTFVRGIDELLPPGARGLMLVGLLAALASTLDTHLNWGASYWSNDVYAGVVCRRWLKRSPGPRELVRVARLSNLLIMAFALAVVVHLGSIQTAWFISLLFGAGMGAVLVLRWLWERINLQAELAAMAASLVTAPLLLFLLGTDPEREWLRLALMALVTTTVAVLAALLTPATDDATLGAFYARVRPYGWWRRTARLCGEDPRAPLRALGRPLIAVIAGTLSLLAMLAGAGTMLFSPSGVQSLGSWLLVGGGLALVPLWLAPLLASPARR